MGMIFGSHNNEDMYGCEGSWRKDIKNLQQENSKLKKHIEKLENALKKIEENSRDCEHCSASLYAKEVLEDRSNTHSL